MRGDRLLADVLYQFTELHRQPLSALKDPRECEYFHALVSPITNLLLVGKGAPQHAYALTDHADV